MGSLETSLVIEGTGKSKQDALSDAFSKIQKQLTENMEGTVIRIEPLEVNFIEGKESTATERFMFFFLPREVKKFYLKLEVKVRYFVVDADSFPFQQIQMKNKIYNTQI